MEGNPKSVAFVGVTGGAGATRLTLECGATLARAGYDVCCLDTAFATQGLARHVHGRIEHDVTDLAMGNCELDPARYPAAFDVPGQLSIVPARAPFERLARAKTPEAAERLGEEIRAAGDAFEYVLVDVPPIATNPAVAGVTAVDRVALVVPDTERGLDGLARSRERLADVGVDTATVVANRVDGAAEIEAAIGEIPDHEHSTVADVPVAADPPEDDPFAPAVAEAVEGLFETDLALEFPESSLLDSYVG
jgi:MinD-like ATPase involved in chromosome partitioning or flagellar assembly